MGKSLRNVVTPDEICDRYGADTFRLYDVSTGSLDASRPWSTRDVVGSHRVPATTVATPHRRTHRPPSAHRRAPGADTLRRLHTTIAGVDADLQALRTNTAIAKIIQLNNHLTKTYGTTGIPRAVAEPLVLLLAPLCPHLAGELWARLGHPNSLAREFFPTADQQWLADDTVDYLVQVNGKLRAHLTMPANADTDSVQAAALAVDKVATLLQGRAPRRVILVPNRLINVVI